MIRAKKYNAFALPSQFSDESEHSDIHTIFCNILSPEFPKCFHFVYLLLSFIRFPFFSPR